MTNEEIKRRIRFAKNTMFNPDHLPHQLEGALRNMLTVKREVEDSEEVDEVLARLYYLLNRYEDSIFYYNELIDSNPTVSKYYLGLYKNSVALGDINRVKDSLLKYKISLIGNTNSIDTGLIDTLVKYVDTGIINTLWNSEKYLFYNIENDKNAFPIYRELVILVNQENFIDAIKKAEELEIYFRTNNIHVEMYSLINLLKMANNKKRLDIKNNINKLYSELKSAVNNKDVSTIYRILDAIKIYSIKDVKVVIQALFILAENNFLEEVTNFIEMMDFPNGCKEQLKIVRKYVNESMTLLNFTDEEIGVYDDAISLGRYYVSMNDYNKAYDVYTWGLYVTNGPIFNYYLGKVLYKLGRYKEARTYFERYVLEGGSKLDKAYLYLSKIAEKYGNKKKSVHYADYVDYCNYVMNKTFDFASPFDQRQEVDMAKERMQRQNQIGEEYFGEDKLEELEIYVRLVKEGNHNEAEEYLANLRKIENKSLNQKLVLRIIDRNKTLYQHK